MLSILQDLRYGRRSFAKSPTFTTGALLALATGIGGNTAMCPRRRAQPGDLEPMQVVGVAAPVREDVLDPDAAPHIYGPSGRTYQSEMHVHVRSAAAERGAVSRLIATLRGELHAIDPGLPVLDLSTLGDLHDRRVALWGVRAASHMLTAFGFLALGLATIGIYGIKAYVVSQRTRKIGIRMALGASSADVRSLVLREACILVAVGIGAGLPLAVRY